MIAMQSLRLCTKERHEAKIRIKLHGGPYDTEESIWELGSKNIPPERIRIPLPHENIVTTVMEKPITANPMNIAEYVLTHFDPVCLRMDAPVHYNFKGGV